MESTLLLLFLPTAEAAPAVVAAGVTAGVTVGVTVGVATGVIAVVAAAGTLPLLNKFSAVNGTFLLIGGPIVIPLSGRNDTALLRLVFGVLECNESGLLRPTIVGADRSDEPIILNPSAIEVRRDLLSTSSFCTSNNDEV